jgi:hypothetical protein
MNFLKNVFKVIPLVIKNIITDASFPLVNPSVIIFFYYQLIYRWKKKLPKKDLPTEHFRR